MSTAELLEWYEKNSKNRSAGSNNQVDEKMALQLAVAEKLKSELEAIEANEELKSKDRRSAKRKAEAIATEETGMTAQELLDWYDKQKHQNEKTGKKQENSKALRRRPRRDPLIAFFGQLSFETTKEDLLEHIRSQLGDTYKVSDKTVKIRMLTEEKTKRFRGMAFVEVEDPEFLYGLLKLHQTYLKGRRINVERTAGGKKDSETRKTKLAQYKKEQEEYFAQVVDNILKEYRTTGELRDDELDDGVITLCKRHSGPVVRAAVAEYIEKGGRDVDNPSAYLTFLVTKFAKEGIHDVEATAKTKSAKSKPSKKRKDDPSGQDTNTRETKRSKSWTDSSDFAKAGVNMPLSVKEGANNGDVRATSKDLATIFPSSQRGKGRGYMRNVR
mmetsp:Transcript_23644/g.41538  ORF Transcript_23644/g.41538 Transcript_23644/m.41538 type:complete len:386 (-) Transcript_23644:1307-2464(-)